MEPPRDSEDPKAWLRYARSDLALVMAGLPPGVLPETLCYHAQQAVEKALKAVLLHHGIPFPRTHHLGALLERMPPSVSPPAEVAQAAKLTIYAVMLRYPMVLESVEPADLQEALELARLVLQWAEGQL